MISLRALARAAPRVATRSVVAPFRQQMFTPVRSSSILPQLSLKQSSIPRLSAAFSTSSSRLQTNEELVAKLDSEIMSEKEMRKAEGAPASVQDFLDNSPFEIHDTPGHQEVVLTRKFGDENIRVTFSIADVQGMSNGMTEDEDPAMYDEDDADTPTDIKSGGGSTQRSGNRARTSGEGYTSSDTDTPADQPEFEDETLLDDEPTEGTYASRLTIVAERPGKGALSIEAVVDAGEILIEDFFHFPNGQLADPKSAEKDWERKALYSGPAFDILDEELKVLLEKWLSERGIDTTLALFVPDYIDFKEQKEYLGFLSNLKNFVSA